LFVFCQFAGILRPTAGGPGALESPNSWRV